MLLVVSGLMFGVTVVGFVLNILSSYQYVRVSASVLFDMRVALYRHLQTLSPRFWARTKLGEWSRASTMIFRGAKCRRRQFVKRAVQYSVPDWKRRHHALAQSQALSGEFRGRARGYLGFATLPAPSGRARARRSRTRVGVGSFLLETLLGHSPGRLGARGSAGNGTVPGTKSELFRRATAACNWCLFSGRRSGDDFDAVHGGTFLYGGKLVIDGAITTGTLVALMSYHLRLLSPVQNLMSLYSNLVSGGVSLSRVWELFDTRADIIDCPGAQPLGNVRGEIEFDRVSFGYGGDAVLEELSFRVIPGTIGASWARAARVNRRWRISSSGFMIRTGAQFASTARTCRISRSPNCAARLCWWTKRLICFTRACARTLRTRGPKPRTMRSSARRNRRLSTTEFWPCLRAMTPSSPNAAKRFPAGERQRIALARALLVNPKVLVLDEPTSALDEANERAIAETLVRVMEGRAAILITHRLSLARIAHQTVFLDRTKAALPVY